MPIRPRDRSSLLDNAPRGRATPVLPISFGSFTLDSPFLLLVCFAMSTAGAGASAFGDHADSRCSLKNDKEITLADSWRELRRLGDSCGRPELPRRDTDDPLEVMAELALVREAGACGDLRQG